MHVHPVDDGAGLFRQPGHHHLVLRLVCQGVVAQGTGIVEDAPEGAAVLDLFDHRVVGVHHGVGVQQALAEERVIELHHPQVGSVGHQRVKILPGFRVVEPDAQFVIAVVGRGRGLDIHDHIPVPVGPEGDGVGFVAVVIRRADRLHLLKHLHQALQVLDLRVAQLLVQVPAQVPGVEKGLMVQRGGGDVVPEAVDVPAGQLAVLLQRGAHVLQDVGAVFRQQVLVFPVKEHSELHRLQVFLPVRAPDDDVAQVAGLHARLEHALVVRNDVDPDVEPVLQDFREPARQFAVPVGELAVAGQRDGLLRQRRGQGPRQQR